MNNYVYIITITWLENNTPYKFEIFNTYENIKDANNDLNKYIESIIRDHKQSITHIEKNIDSIIYDGEFASSGIIYFKDNTHIVFHIVDQKVNKKSVYE